MICCFVKIIEKILFDYIKKLCFVRTNAKYRKATKHVVLMEWFDDGLDCFFIMPQIYMNIFTFMLLNTFIDKYYHVHYDDSPISLLFFILSIVLFRFTIKCNFTLLLSKLRKLIFNIGEFHLNFHIRFCNT